MNTGASNVEMAWVARVCCFAPESYNPRFMWGGS